MKKAFLKLMGLTVLMLAVAGCATQTGGDTEGGEGTTEAFSGAVEVVIENTSAGFDVPQPISPGLVVVHSHDASINFEGQTAPVEVEALAEVGNPAGLAAMLEGVEGVASVTTFDAPVLPGESATVSVEVDCSADQHVSVMAMAVASNDGLALVDAVSPCDSYGAFDEQTTEAVMQDAGFEENGELGGGFEAGQPDPSRGEENLENGTATEPQAEVSTHPQLTESIMKVMMRAAQ